MVEGIDNFLYIRTLLIFVIHLCHDMLVKFIQEVLMFLPVARNFLLEVFIRHSIVHKKTNSFLFSSCKGTELDVDLLKKRSSDYAAAKELAIRGILISVFQLISRHFKALRFANLLHIHSVCYQLAHYYYFHCCCCCGSPLLIEKHLLLSIY